MTSSINSGVFLTAAFSPSIRVMDSRFSVTRMSQRASSFTECNSSRRCWGVRLSSCDSSTSVAPTIPVRGVRMSWLMPRSRLPRTFSRCICRWVTSTCFARLARAPARMEMVIITRKVRGKPARVKLICQ